jgi:hypothetical protein
VLPSLIFALSAEASVGTSVANTDDSGFGNSSSIFSSSSVGFDATDYPTSSNSQGQSFFPSLSLYGNVAGRAGIFVDHVNLESLVGLGQGHPVSIEAPEAYAGLATQSSSSGIYIGRKKESWSTLDDTWQLGIWQPRFRWDDLRPETVGLTGVFLEASDKDIELTAFGTPIFIPERGASVSADQGQLSSPSPWFYPPAPRINIFGTLTPSNYQIVVPDLSSLIFNPGGGVKIRGGAHPNEAGGWVSASFAYQPVNQLLMGYSGYLSVANPIHAVVTLVPRVGYHELAAAEGGYNAPNWRAWISVLGENPVGDSAVPVVTDSNGLTLQALSPSLSVSTGFEWDVTNGELSSDNHAPGPMVGANNGSYRGYAPRTVIQFLSLSQWGGNAADVGPNAGSGSTPSVFEERYPFQEAVSLGISTPIWGRFTGSTRMIYDVTHSGTISSSELRYTVSHWVLGVGADFLASSQTDPNAPGTDFISHYQADNQIHTGVSYVF